MPSTNAESSTPSFGGAAAIVYADIPPSEDIDTLVRATIANLERVAQALTALNAKQADGTKFPGPITAGDLVQFNTRWQTDTGPVDILVDAKGPNDTRIRYGDIASRIYVVEQRDGPALHLASLADIIAMKAAADRPKDHAVLPTLIGTLEARAAAAASMMDEQPLEASTAEQAPAAPYVVPIARPTGPSRRTWWQRLTGR